MDIRYETIGGTDGELRLTITGSVIEVPCLAGEDVCREPGSILVEVIDGQLRHARTGDELAVIPDGPIMGWGSLSTEASYLVRYAEQCAGAGAGVNVPASVVEHLRKHHALQIN